MSISEDTVNEIFADLFFEFRAEAAIKFEEAPSNFDNSMLEFMTERIDRLLRVLRIAAGIALSRGREKVTKDDLATALKVDAEDSNLNFSSWHYLENQCSEKIETGVNRFDMIQLVRFDQKNGTLGVEISAFSVV